MATRTPQLPATDPWDTASTQAETVEDAETMHLLMARVSHDLPARLQDPMEVAGIEVDASDLFPEDEWANVPQLPKDRVKDMADSQQAFQILDVQMRKGEFGQIFVLIVDVSGEVFSTVLGADEEYRKEKLAKVKYLLLNGARQVGPFRFVERETGKGNAYRTIAAIPKGQRGKKSSLVDVRGK